MVGSVGGARPFPARPADRPAVPHLRLQCTYTRTPHPARAHRCNTDARMHVPRAHNHSSRATHQAYAVREHGTKQIEPEPTPSVAAKVCMCVPCDEPTRARTSARMLCWRRARGGRGCSTVQRDGVCWLWGARAACAADGTRLGLYGT